MCQQANSEHLLPQRVLFLWICASKGMDSGPNLVPVRMGFLNFVPLRAGVSRCCPSRGIHFTGEQTPPYPRAYGICGCWHLATLGCQTGLFSWHLAKSETETLLAILISERDSHKRPSLTLCSVADRKTW